MFIDINRAKVKALRDGDPMLVRGRLDAKASMNLLKAMIKSTMVDNLSVYHPAFAGDYVALSDIAYLDTTASRLHGASIAGLVVGAMGVFIFGLYLRRWLRERKAAA